MVPPRVIALVVIGLAVTSCKPPHPVRRAARADAASQNEPSPDAAAGPSRGGAGGAGGSRADASASRPDAGGAGRDAAVARDVAAGGTAGTRDAAPAVPTPDAARPAPRPDMAAADLAAPPPSRDAASTAGDREVLFVVKDPGALEVAFGDVTLRSRLEGRGFRVTLADDDDRTLLAQAAGKSAVIVSSSVASEKVGPVFRDLAVPVVCLEPAIYDDMEMTGPTKDVDFGYKMESQVAIVNATHALAAMLNGTVAFWGTPNTIGFGVAPNAEKVAAVPGSTTQLAIFGYKAGAAMFGARKAPARRVGFVGSDGNGGGLTDEAGKLFDAAIDWAMAR